VNTLFPSEDIMSDTAEASGLPEEHRGDKAENANASGKRGKEERADSRAGPGPDSEQTARDQEEKRKHPASENALDSSQDKNPIPRGSTAD
jgi:hypothetical protein